MLGGETLRDLRVPLRRADGKALEMLVSAAPIRDRAEGISRIVWIGSDDGPRLRGLAAMIDVQRMQAFEQLISGIAHDFNNRLTVIAGTTEILLQEERSADDREMLSSVLEAGRRAAALVDQLVSTTRRGYDDQRHLDLRVLLDQLEPELIRRTPRGATIRVESGHVRLPVEADRADLEQAVLNLVTNAFESLGAAGAVEVRARRLDDESRADHRVVELTVTDDGTGMDRATRGRALEPFFSTKAGGGRSRGLGLPAVQGVVLRSQGELVLESEEGRGTTVTVHLPLREPPEADRRAAPREVTRRDRPAEATILLVDDEPEVRAVAHRVLVAAGYAVIEASHAEEALAILTAPGTDIDLLLSDIVMPGRSGIELAHDFTEHHPQRPVLLLSGFVGESAPGGRAAAVPFPLLPKPITREDLLAAVAEALPAPS